MEYQSLGLHGLTINRRNKMSACERCWRDSGGDPERYSELLKTQNCTPEQQAGGEDAGICPQCNRKTIHLYTGRCMVVGCDYEE